MDVNKVLLDCEHESEIINDPNRNSKFRYCVINAGVGYIAKTVHKAVDHKPYMGSGCYISSACVQFFTTCAEFFDVHIEKANGEKIELNNEETMYLTVMNGKYGGGRIVMAPSAILNDGLLDICMQHGPVAVSEIAKFIKNAVVKKGAHIYKQNYACFRGKSVKIINRNNATGRNRTSSNDSDNLGIEEANSK